MPTSPSHFSNPSVFLALSPFASLSVAQDDKKDGDAKKPPTIAKKTDGLEKREGLLTTYVDRDRGKLWLEVAAAEPGGGFADSMAVRRRT